MPAPVSDNAKSAPLPLGSMASFSARSLLAAVEISSAEAIRDVARASLGDEAWEAGVAALLEAAEAARQWKRLTLDRKSKEDADAQAEAEARAANAPDETRSRFSFFHASLLNHRDFGELAREQTALAAKSDMEAALALAELPPASADAARAALRSLFSAMGSPEAAQALSEAAFVEISAREALLPLQGKAAVAERLGQGGVALRVGEAASVLKSQSDPEQIERRASDRKFGFEPAADANGGSFESLDSAVVRAAVFHAPEETAFLARLAQVAMGRAVGLPGSEISSFLNAIVLLAPAEPSQRRNGLNEEENLRPDHDLATALPTAFKEQAAALAQAQENQRDADSALNFLNASGKPRSGPPVQAAALLANFLCVASGLEAPSLLSAEANADKIPKRLSSFWKASAERSGASERSQNSAAHSIWSLAAEPLADRQALVERAFAAAETLRLAARPEDAEFSQAVDRAAKNAQAAVPARQMAWMGQNGADQTARVARRVFGERSLSASHLARVARAPQAFEQALDECGPVGLLAASLCVWLDLRADGLSSGNALCAMARDAWIARGGSPASWRLMAQLPPVLLDAVVSAGRAASWDEPPAERPEPREADRGLALYLSMSRRRRGSSALESILPIAELCAAAHGGAERLAMALVLHGGLSAEGVGSQSNLRKEHEQSLDGALPPLAAARAPLAANRGPRMIFTIPRDIDPFGAGPAWITGVQEAGAAWSRRRESNARVLLDLFSAPAGRGEDALQDAQIAIEALARKSRAPFVVRDLLDRVAATDLNHASAEGSVDGAQADEGANAARRRETPSARLAREIGEVRDWLLRSEPGVWLTLPEKTQWPTMARRAKEWHEWVLSQECAEKERTQWAPLLGEQSDGPYKAVELTNGGQLHAEGRAMHHCVSSYAQDCASGDCRIFSILKDGERHSTLEIRRVRDGWAAGQNLGYCNSSRIDAAALAFGSKLANKATELRLAPQSILSGDENDSLAGQGERDAQGAPEALGEDLAAARMIDRQPDILLRRARRRPAPADNAEPELPPAPPNRR